MNTKLTYPVIAGISITTDENGLFNLNSLRKASGLGLNKSPSQWLRTQTAQELAEELTDVQKCTSPINTVKGGLNQGTFAHELLAISYAGWISPKFQLMVNQTFVDYRAGKLNKNTDSGLPEYRKAKAMEVSVRILNEVFKSLPNLSEQSKQVAYAYTINPVVGAEIIPIPTLEEKYYTATEIGSALQVSANKIGRMAKDNNLKTSEYGKFFMDKSQYSCKQVESFRYNEKAIKKFHDILIAEQESATRKMA